MIHYHGTPVGGERVEAAKFLRGRHAFISYYRAEDAPAAAEVCQSFAVDNGAFSAWRSGSPVTDWSGYYAFVDEWRAHPAFDWAIIPDVIDGSERDNDELLVEWSSRVWRAVYLGVPVWHLHESLERLSRLVLSWPRVALGSSGDYATIGTERWLARMAELMRVACDGSGRPRTKLHGLRMLDPAVFCQYPFASADSTNAVRNASNVSRFGTYKPPHHSARVATIADRIESHQSAAVWTESKDEQFSLFGG